MTTIAAQGPAGADAGARAAAADDARAAGPEGAIAVGADFGPLTPLLAPASVAVVGASDREGNLGGLAVRFLRKFGFRGAVWPVNAGRAEVAGLPCFRSLDALPAPPDLVIIAVPAEGLLEVVHDCGRARVPAAIAWAGGFAETGAAGRARQDAVAAACRDYGLRLCGPNCIGIINTSIGLTASFSSMMTERDTLTAGRVSIVSQSGGIGVMAHARAEDFGLGFRVMVSCGNEAVLGIPDFVEALVHDDGTRVIAIYTEGLSDPARFVEALAAARERRKPVVVLKGGATAASSRAALAHTGRLAGVDRTYDAILREFAAIRVYSTEELLDVALQLASLRPGQLPAGDRVLVSSFGGGSGVICTDQCGREGLAVPVLDARTQAILRPLVTSLSSVQNPIDFTPGMVTDVRHRAQLPEALRTLGSAPDYDSWLFLAAGFGSLAPAVAGAYEAARSACDKPMYLTWQAMPVGVAATLAAHGNYVFTEHARAVRAAAHVVRHARDLRHRIARIATVPPPLRWSDFVAPGVQVVSEHVVARILEAAGLPVARGLLAVDAASAAAAACSVGFPVAVKGISASITHRAAAGLVALELDSPEAVAAAFERFTARAAERGVALEGCWVQHMFRGERELLVTAFRDAEFGVMVGCGIGGAHTEIVDDVVFARAPIDAAGAADLIARLRTVERMPELLTTSQVALAADYIARFAALAASASWSRFTLEINPLKLGATAAAAVDGLLLIEPPAGPPIDPHVEPPHHPSRTVESPNASL